MHSTVIFWKLVVLMLSEVVSVTQSAPLHPFLGREKPIVETDFWHDHSKDDDSVAEDMIAFREKYKDILQYVRSEDLDIEEEFVFDEIKALDRVVTPENEPQDEKPTPGTFQADMMFIGEQWVELMNTVVRDEDAISSDAEINDNEEINNDDHTNTKDDEVTVMDDADKPKRRSRRKATAFTTHRWPQAVIPVSFKLDNDADKQNAIAAMIHWTTNTCLRFVYFTPETAKALGHNTYLSFENGQQGCWSFVGHVAPSKQTLSVGKGCGGFGTFVHEIGHAVGFHHEQSRPDRDFSVQILFENIALHSRGDFYKYSGETINNLGIAYDEGSIMQYGTYAFSVNGLPTILTKNPLKQSLLGQRVGLSPADIKAINIMYNCQNT